MNPEAAERSLADGIAYLHALFAAYVARAEGGTAKMAGSLPVFPESDGPLLRLAMRLRLSPFERDLLLLCAAVELDSGIAQLCARAQSSGGTEPARVQPTFSLALSLLPEGHWTAIHPEALLRRYGLLRLVRNDDSKDALTLTPLRIEESVLHYLLGLPPIDERLRPWIEWLPSTQPSVPEAVPEAVPAAWTASVARLEQAWTPGAPPRLALLAGGDESARREIAAHTGAIIALLPLASLLPVSPQERDGVLRLWEREAVLAPNRVLLLEIGDEIENGSNRDILAAVLRRVTALPGRILLAVGERMQPLVTGLLTQSRPYILVEVTRPSRDEQRDAWRRVLATGGIDKFETEETNRITERLVGQFALGIGQIESVGASVLLPGVSPKVIPTSEEVAEQLWDRCRIAARPRLEELAERVETKASWDDLILPVGAQQLLHDIVAHARARTIVSDHWGFGKRGSRGLGISALFSGPSGTGKTLAAEVLAGELRLDLYRIDLSALVSKYIGETEKNLRRVFDAAEAGGALLLFDEADALFGKRSDVKDSHDRYANIEVSYLLQRMESYQGLAILTTNMKGAMDTAFLRRLQFAVSFPFPDVVQRARMWARAFPPETPTEGLDPQTLAQLHIAGGNIRSMALYAASLAADQGDSVQMRHLLRAARAEYAKLEKPLTDAEIAGWMTNGTRGIGDTR